MFDDLLKNIDALYTASPSSTPKESEELGSLFSALGAAARREPSATASYVLSPDPLALDDQFRLDYMLEALAREPQHWEALFSSQLDRLLRLCDEHPANRRLFACMDSFAFLSGTASRELRSDLCGRLIAASNSPHPSVRRVTASLLGDLDPTGNSAARACLERLLADPDWRVRNLAEDSLVHRGLLPAGYTVSLLDRLRRRLFSASQFNYC